MTCNREHDGPNILVVDDDDALLRIHARALASRGYRVETAPDGTGGSTTCGRMLGFSGGGVADHDAVDCGGNEAPTLGQVRPVPLPPSDLAFTPAILSTPAPSQARSVSRYNFSSAA
jgi:hypothetical protein